MNKKRKLLRKNEEVSGLKAQINTRKVKGYLSIITDVFFDQKRINLCFFNAQ